ncbi:MAG: 50S ribosomal protein L15 [Planctomycetia bacterium]|nr:50S ribosomal protein L15 [Planctomycetia bacterium]
MDLHGLYHPKDGEQPVHNRRPKKRVGRGIGSGHGKTSTRGAKGQWASAGAGHPRFHFEGGQMPLFRRMPKRGFSHATWDKFYLPVNVGDISEHFKEGDVVDHAALKKVGLAKGPCDGIRILGAGDVTKKLTIKASHFSKSAKEKLEAKGGKCELLAAPKPPVRNKMKPKKTS